MEPLKSRQPQKVTRVYSNEDLQFYAMQSAIATASDTLTNVFRFGDIDEILNNKELIMSLIDTYAVGS